MLFYKGCILNSIMSDSNLVLLGTFTVEGAQNIAGTWDILRQEPPDETGLVRVYVCPEEKAWREKQCSSDI
jgi:hypothetical protein